jgi:hypothetical protein
VGPHGDALDVFDTAGMRARVLAAWAASPARFREDANAEEDLALGGYRDRVVVELAQNAADAAARAGVPGRLRLTLREGVLVAANTGAPLTAAGVESLSTLRASAKRDEAPEAGAAPSGEASAPVGRFGVGFAAALAVTDSPVVVSRSGGVRWSLPDAAALAGEVARDAAGLADELVRRGGAVPVLRLPFPAEGSPPEGYDTAVVLPLRDNMAEELARRLLAEIDDALLLALPALTEIAVDVDGGSRVLTADRRGSEVMVADGGRRHRWRLATASGLLAPELLADRPVEERARPAWSVTWAVPVGEAGVPVPLPPQTPAVVHAPTPTDEPLGLPALLLASFPLDPSRRHVAPGPLRDFLVERAAETYAGLLAGLEPHPALLTLVPGPVGQGELDARIRRAVLALLPATPFLAAAEPPDETMAAETGERADTRLRPRDAVALERADPALVAVLAPVLTGLLPPGWDRHRTALTAVGVRLLALGELIDLLAGVEREPSWWRRFYAALAGLVAGGVDRDALAGLPVPLADGRRVTGPRGVLVPPPGLDAEPLRALGLRVVHPDAAHPVLERLGAVPATPRAVLADPLVRAAVATSYDADDPDTVADAVLAVVAAARPAPGEEPWLAELTLPADDGEYAPAGELMLPGSPIAAVVEPGELGLVDEELVRRWGADVLEAAGVLRTFGLVRDVDVILDPDGLDHDLDGEDGWLRDALAALPAFEAPPLLPELVAVRDLDLVADDAWPRALALLAAPPLRAAVTDPARVVLPGGSTRQVPSYTAWWLRGRPVLGGRRPAGLRAAGSDPLLAGLYDEAATELDPEFLRALGVRTTLAALLADPDGPRELLDRLADPARPLDRGRLGRIYRELAAADADLPGPPDRLRALVEDRVEVVEAGAAVVVDAPCLLPLLGARPRLPVPPAAAAGLADLLDLPLASELVDGEVTGEGLECPVPAAVRELLAESPRRYLEHESLLVDGVEVDWWWDGTGLPRAATLDGLANALAWAAGRWERRFEVAAVLAEPERLEELRTGREFEG